MWRDSTPTNASVSLGINGDLGSALMMSHGMTLFALREVKDEFFTFAVAALVAVQPIWAGDGEDDYVLLCLTPHYATRRCAPVHRREASSSRRALQKTVKRSSSRSAL